MPGAFQPIAFQPFPAFQQDGAATRNNAAGSNKRRRKRTVVEIDGQTFLVNSEEDAQQLIEVAQAAATEQAIAEAQVVIRKRKVSSRRNDKPLRLDPIELEAPTVKSDDAGLKEELQAALNAVYAKAAAEAELALHMHYARILDEEESIILLLLANDT